MRATIQASLPLDIIQKIDALSRAEKITKSEAIERLIRAGITDGQVPSRTDANV